MPTAARIIADSISEAGVRLTTLVLEYPRIIHSEFMTHRMFSRNASSSRAIPVEVQMKRIVDEPFFPSYWGANKRGMQAEKELTEGESKAADFLWEKCLNAIVFFVQFLVRLGVHKQLANRLLEPFSHIQVVVTATEWDNFFLQRLDKNAQPEIQELARVMKEVMDNSTPKLLKAGEWHLPFVPEIEKEGIISYLLKTQGYGDLDSRLEVAKKLSVARCARVSYGLNERGWGDIEKDLALAEMLLTNNHWSPWEHQSTPIDIEEFDRLIDDGLISYAMKPGITHIDRNYEPWSGNFKGWIQNRQLIQQSI